jgi:hypothetical protein
MLAAGSIAMALLGGCETTGDPTQGGLFGWSEKKAQERQAEKEAMLSKEETRMRTEQDREAGLKRTVELNNEDLEGQRDELSQLLANAEALEQEAPTPAMASRARRLLREIDAVRNDEKLPVDERWRRLRGYSAKVDQMRAEFAAGG